MKTTKLITILLVILGTSTVNAQFWKKLTKKVQNRVEQKVENKLNKETDKAIDNALTKKDKTKSTTANTSYTFTKSITLDITDDTGNSYPIEFLTGTTNTTYAMRMANNEMGNSGNVITVITPKNATMFMDISGMKMKKTTPITQVHNQFKMPENISDTNKYSYKKTGASKTILGYACEEYKASYNNTKNSGTAIMWITKDIPTQNGIIPMLHAVHVNGFILELHSTHQGKSTSLIVSKITSTKTTIHTKDYKNFGF